MENANQNSQQHGEHKASQKAERGYKGNLAHHQPVHKKVTHRKLSGEKFSRLFAHLAYQELDAD